MNQYKFEDLSLGQSESFDTLVSEGHLEKFTSLSGDTHPIHVNEEEAKSRGFKGRVCHGLLSSSFYSTLVGLYLPGKYALLQGIDIDLSHPVYVGDRLFISAKVIFLQEALKRVELKAQIKNGEGKRVSKAKIRVGLYA